MTGRYFLRTGLYNTRFGGDTIDASEITLAEVLKPRGYRTGIFGKWHLGRYAEHHPNAQGFDEFLGFLEGHTERYDYPDLQHNGEPVHTRGYITDVLTDAAIRFIQAHQNQPFFCYVPYNVPHTPLIAGDAHGLQERGDEKIAHHLAAGVPLRDARIYAMVERCDEEIGRLLDTLKKLEIEQNTVVLFMHDNGGISKHWKGGMKGNKASVFEGGVRSPLFVRWPGRIPAGLQVEALSSHVDLLPTLADWASAPLPQDRPLDGKSLVPLLKSPDAPPIHQYVYHHWDRYFPNTTNRWAITGTRYKLAQGKLYDLLADPGEARDLSAKYPEVTRQMRAEFVRWFDDVTSGRIYQPVPIPVGDPRENPVEIQASWSTVAGNTQYIFLGYHWDTVEGWKTPEDSASWRLDIRESGRYRVRVSYGAEREAQGRRFEVRVGRSAVTGKVEPTATPDSFHVRTLGVLDLLKGDSEFRIRPMESTDTECFRLNRVWLERLP